MSFDIVGNTHRLDLKDPRVMRMCQHLKGHVPGASKVRGMSWMPPAPDLT
jgi:hypothetical protein